MKKKYNYIIIVYKYTVIKKIAILTSGGDCAGLNAVIRAVTLELITNIIGKFMALKMVP